MAESIDLRQQNNNPTQNIWDKIEAIQNILESNDELTEQNKKEINELLTQIAQETKKNEEKATSYYQENIFEKLQTLFPDNDFFKIIDKDSPQFIDNIDLLIDGEKAFDEICHQIDTAQEIIEINIFIWRKDNTGKRLAQKLLDAANDPNRPNLKIKIVKDRVGGIFEHAEQNKQSFFHPELTAEESFKAFIVDNAYSNHGEAENNEQEENPLLSQILNHPDIEVVEEERNDHSKYYVFDNKTIITGGMNIGDEYLSWHDYMVKMESPLLVQKLKGRLSGEDDFDYGSSIEFSLNRWNTDSDILEQKEIEPKVLELLEYAKQNKKPVTIEMAYFGDTDITKKIIETANSGVTINIILPKEANVQNDLNKSIMKEILNKTEGNISIYFYPGMLHAKMIHVGEIPSSVDGSINMDEVTTGITFLGSANLNVKATEDLAELNILVDDKDCEFTQDIKKQLFEDINKCDAYIPPPKIAFSRIKAYFESKA